jgi:hypothetical protein
LRKTVLLVFAVALLARVLFAAVQAAVGIQTVPGFPTISPWTDFYGIYVPQLISLAKGLIPYRDFAYSYAPLFLYSLFPFFKIGGSVLASAPIIGADSVTAVAVFKICEILSTERFASVAGLIYAILPFALFYEGYLWLGSQPMTLFMLLGIVLFLQEKTTWAALSISVAALFKQQALFVVPPLLIWLLVRRRQAAWKPILAFVGAILLVSLPFLALAPFNYLDQLSFGLISHAPPQSATTSVSTTTVPLVSCTSLIMTSQSYVCLAIPNPLFTELITIEGWIGQNLAIPFYLITLLALAGSRDKQKQLGLHFAASQIGFLLVFSFLVHELYPYYLLPVYAAVMPYGRSRLAPVTVLVFSTLALMSPLGLTQAFLASCSLLFVIALDDSHATSSALPGRQPRLELAVQNRRPFRRNIKRGE